MSEPWQRLSYAAIAREDADDVGDLLEECGALSVTMIPCDVEHVFDEPGTSNANAWGQTDIVVLLDADSDAGAFIARAAAARPMLPQPSVERLNDQDWISVWREHFPPRCFADRIWVCPVDTPLEARGLPVIRLDPGLAFGTGDHPTTSLCLRGLCEHVSPRTGFVIDFGCGSGILAIAAVKLGAQRVLGVDIDPQAVAVARENAAMNEVASAIEIVANEDLGTPPQADILVANILLEPLLRYAGEFAALLRPGGVILLSGLLAEQANHCMQAYQDTIEFKPPVVEGDWAMLEGIRR